MLGKMNSKGLAKKMYIFWFEIYLYGLPVLGPRQMSRQFKS